MTFVGARAAQAEVVVEPDPPQPAPDPYGDPQPQPTAPSGDYYPPTEPSLELAEARPLRQGFFGGGSLGLGSVTPDCEGQGCGDYAGIGFSLDAGWAFSPKWAVVGEIWFTGGVRHGDSEEGAELLSMSAGVRYWAVDRLWLSAAIAATSFNIVREGRSGSTFEADGSGLVFGAGVELWRAQNGHLVIDLRARLGFFSVDGVDQNGNGTDGINIRQTSAFAALSWY